MPWRACPGLSRQPGGDRWQRPVGAGPVRLLQSLEGEGEGTLIVTGCSAPRKLGLQLPDLASRLDWGVSFHLDELDDEGKLSALQLRAELRGFKLPIDVGRFLLNRLSRDMRTLLATLNRLDNASFRAKRKLTIPFVKEILEL